MRCQDYPLEEETSCTWMVLACMFNSDNSIIIIMIVLCLALFSLLIQASERVLTVGVLTLESTQSDFDQIGHSHYLLESQDLLMRVGGLYAVAIPFNASDALLYSMLDQVNGVFLTGGDLDLFNPTTGKPHPYTVTAQKVFEYAKQHTDKGDYFPILGVCQGFELLHILAANNSEALGYSDKENACLNTNFAGDPLRDFRMLSKIDKSVLQAMSNENMLFHAHERGIPIFKYTTFPVLSQFFNIVSTNLIDGQRIVSMAEARDYPMYLTQFHPEIIFDFATDINNARIPASYQLASQLSLFFAGECAKNNHTFKNETQMVGLFVKNGHAGKMSFYLELVNAYGFDY